MGGERGCPPKEFVPSRKTHWQVGKIYTHASKKYLNILGYLAYCFPRRDEKVDTNLIELRIKNGTRNTYHDFKIQKIPRFGQPKQGCKFETSLQFKSGVLNHVSVIFNYG